MHMAPTPVATGSSAPKVPVESANKRVESLLAALRRAQDSAEAREIGARLREAIRELKRLTAA
jgi:hypothetical protein